MVESADTRSSEGRASGREGSSPSLATVWQTGMSALRIPGSSNGRTAGSEPVGVGSTPAPGALVNLDGEMDIMRPSEGRGPGSTPGRGTATVLGV